MSTPKKQQSAAVLAAADTIYRAYHAAADMYFVPLRKAVGIADYVGHAEWCATHKLAPLDRLDAQTTALERICEDLRAERQEREAKTAALLKKHLPNEEA